MQLFPNIRIYIIMKNLIISLLVLLTVLVSAPSTYAIFGQDLRETVKDTVEEGKEAGLSPAAIRKNVREEIKVQVTERNESLMERVKNFVKKRVRFNARITGEITSIGENSLTVTGDDDKSYVLNVNSETKLVRRFGGLSTISEFNVGNKVNAFGVFTSEDETTVDAKLIRNLSIQKKWGVFFGIIKSKDDTSFTLESSNKGTQTVYVEEAELKNREEKEITYTELKINDRVRVKGMWDRSSNEITDVDEVKNFSVPTQPTQD